MFNPHSKGVKRLYQFFPKTQFLENPQKLMYRIKT